MANLVLNIFVVFVTLWFSRVKSQSAINPNGVFAIEKAKKHPNGVFRIRKISGPESDIRCALLCSRKGRCNSYNFNKKAKECELIEHVDVDEKLLTGYGIQNDSDYLLAYRVLVDGRCPTTASSVKNPCQSEPCGNGTTCVRTKCGRDYKCAVAGVFHISSPAGIRYLLTFDVAKQICALHGAILASYAQLVTAWEHGYDVCACGWLDDGTLAYPIVRIRQGCGHGSPGIQGRPGDIYDCRTFINHDYGGMADAYCYKP